MTTEKPASKPSRAREPSCVHTWGGMVQPMSACRICKDSPLLQLWADEWAAWLSENPDSFEAQNARERADGWPWS